MTYFLSIHLFRGRIKKFKGHTGPLFLFVCSYVNKNKQELLQGQGNRWINVSYCTYYITFMYREALTSVKIIQSKTTCCTLDLSVKLRRSPLRKSWREKIHWLSCLAASLPGDRAGQPQLCQTLTPVKTQIACGKIWQGDWDWWASSCLAHEEGSGQPSTMTADGVSRLCVWGLAPVFDKTLQVIDTVLSLLGNRWHSFGSANQQGPSQWSTTNQCGPVNTVNTSNGLTFGVASFHMNAVFIRIFWPFWTQDGPESFHEMKLLPSRRQKHLSFLVLDFPGASNCLTHQQPEQKAKTFWGRSGCRGWKETGHSRIGEHLAFKMLEK